MTNDLVVLHEDALDELYAWIDNIPLSRPKKNIARDFSDGVLVAEIIAHFMPKFIDIHNYFSANSANHKKVNWTTLNRKVLSKLGMKISDATIQHLVDSKPGAIEQVLCDIRPRIERFVVSGAFHQSACGGNSTDDGYPRPEIIDYQIDENLLSPICGSLTCTRAQAQFNVRASDSNHQSPIGGNSYRGQGYIASPGLRSLYNEVGVPNNNYSISSPVVYPSQITYRGQKMVPLGLLEEKLGEIKGLEQANKSVQTKIHRIETLVNAKDQRIEDLTHQLHNLRTMYELKTSTTWQPQCSNV